MIEHDDYIVGDEFDWDRNDDGQHCEHGTFIGSWWGPDVLCGWCEDGIRADDLRFRHRGFWPRNQKRKARRTLLRSTYDRCVEHGTPPWIACRVLHLIADGYSVR